MKLYTLDNTSISLLNFALFSIKELPLRDTFPLVERTLTIAHRRPLIKWGDALIVTIKGASCESEIELTVKCQNKYGRFELDEVEVDRVIWYFLGLDGLEDVKSIEVNETSEVII